MNWLQGLNIKPASFLLTAGAGANASVAGVVDVSAASTVPDLFTYVAEIAVDSSYVVSGTLHLPPWIGTTLHVAVICRQTSPDVVAQCCMCLFVGQRLLLDRSCTVVLSRL